MQQIVNNHRLLTGASPRPARRLNPDGVRWRGDGRAKNVASALFAGKQPGGACQLLVEEVHPVVARGPVATSSRALTSPLRSTNLMPRPQWYLPIREL